MEPVFIKLSCPSCKEKNTVKIEKNRLSCTQEKCDFSASFCCPVCDSLLDGVTYFQDELGEYFDCHDCKNKVHIKRVKHLIDNKLSVDPQVRCEYCQGPTVYRQEANMSHRCFFFQNARAKRVFFQVGSVNP